MSFVRGLLRRVPLTIGVINCIEYLVFKSLMFSLKRKKIVDESGCLCVRRHKIREKLSAGDGKRYNRLVSLIGFFYSGSGAVADLLSEYSSASVFSCVGDDGSLRKDSKYSGEFDMLRHLGGIFSLEMAFQTKNVFVRDSMIRIFLRMVAYLHFDERRPFGQGFLAATRKFLDEIIAVRCETDFTWNFCPHLRCLGDAGSRLVYGGNTACHYLKDMSCAEFRKIARKYISSVLQSFDANDFLVLDQACADFTGDIDMYLDYLGEKAKIIAVFRDPRDVYVDARIKREDAIPIDVDNFIWWYEERLNRYVDLRHDSFMMVRFEDLVLEYDKTVIDIEKFLGLNPAEHRKKKIYFNPDVSIKNVRMWQMFPDQTIIETIHKSLRRYCYEPVAC